VPQRTPVLKQFSILGIVCQLGLLGLISLAIYPFDQTNFFFFAVIAFVALSLLLRTFIPRHHQRGISLVHRGKFGEAADCFEKSYRFFKRHAWVDRFRFITVLNSSRTSYKELALLNRAYCLSRCGLMSEAVQLYRQTLEEYPQSEIARKSLDLLS
jgi:tetratricopeptide (TPR) repeat protein